MISSVRESTGRDGVLDTRRAVTRVSVGAVVPAVALSAHGLAGGDLPTSGTLLVAGIGVVAAMLTRGAGLVRVFGVLTGAQAASHVALMLVHGHAWSLEPASMLLTHLLAVPASALLIVAVAQLISLITSMVRVPVFDGPTPVAGRPRYAELPVLRATRVMTGSIRGPPIAAAYPGPTGTR